MGRAAARASQLSLLVESDEELPIVGVLKVSGALRVERDVPKDARVHVRVCDESGVVLSECVAVVASVTLTTKTPESGPYVERAHAARVSQ